MRTFLHCLRWAEVVLGAAAWAGVYLEVWVLVRFFPTDVAGCESTAVFGCTDWTAFGITLLSLPLWYAAWSFVLRRRALGWGWALATPLVVSVGSWRLAGLGPETVPGVVPVLSYVVVAATWSAVVPRARAEAA